MADTTVETVEPVLEMTDPNLETSPPEEVAPAPEEVKEAVEEVVAEVVEEVKEVEEKTLTNVDAPANIQDVFEELPRELEDLCAQIYAQIDEYFNAPGATVEFGLLVVRVMEMVEDHKLPSTKKRILAIRCVAEYVRDSIAFPEENKAHLMRTIPAAVEAIIKLSRGEKLNRDVKEARNVQAAYVTRRALDRILKYVKKNNYDIDAVLENSWFITMELMYVVGGYPSLTGIQKKAIVTDVFKQLIADLQKDGQQVDDPFLQATLDTLPALVDTFVRVGSGEYHINDMATVCCFGLGACLRVMNKNKGSSKKPDFTPA
jgi:hypothetical protein